MVRFLTAEWADTCRDVINGWPDPEHRAAKLSDFWDWIDMVRPMVGGRVALSVRDVPPGADGDTLVLDFEDGTITAAAVANRPDVEDGATFLLAGDYQDWMSMLDGYDVGKMIMYRKLMLERGETLKFFLAAFFWTELLAAIQGIPTEALQAA